VGSAFAGPVPGVVLSGLRLLPLISLLLKPLRNFRPQTCQQCRQNHEDNARRVPVPAWMLAVNAQADLGCAGSA
jgi:hypothetical protein